MSDPQVNDLSPAGSELERSPVMISPGAQLAAYRKERGWTIEQVASQLNLAPRQIAAIESDDHPALPGMAIVRGFIRAYAKLLKVDAAPLLASLSGETVLAHESIAPRKSLATPFSETRLPSLTERQALSSKWVIGLLLVLLLGVAFWALQQGSDLVGVFMTALTQPEAGAKPAANAGVNTPPVAEKADEPSLASASVPAKANASPEPAAAPTVPSVAPMPVGPVAEPSPSTPAPEGKGTLVLKMREDSWLEIKRASSGAVIVSRLAKGGETETLEVTEPVSLVIGNVAGVDASFRGTALELKSRGSTGNVARLNLK
ncbi:MAG: RodZ domain-containing protein [Noviherbaspirillum sp.]